VDSVELQTTSANRASSAAATDTVHHRADCEM